jgi:hypothetical protein
MLVLSNSGLLALGDIFITVSLYFFLDSSRTGLRQMDNVLQRMCNYMITRGLVTVYVLSAVRECDY